MPEISQADLDKLRLLLRRIRSSAGEIASDPEEAESEADSIASNVKKALRIIDGLQ